jgi:hypothetical protein
MDRVTSFAIDEGCNGSPRTFSASKVTAPYPKLALIAIKLSHHPIEADYQALQGEMDDILKPFSQLASNHTLALCSL